MPLLLSKTLWGVVGGVLFTLLIFQWGNKYGPNAQLVAAMNAARAETNGKLIQQKKEYAETDAREQAAALKAAVDFQAAGKLDCLADPASAEAINKLIGD